jgi:hypothetical protein
VVKNIGYIGDGSAQHSFGKRSLNGLLRRLINRFEQANIIDNSAQKVVPIRLLCAPWRLSGYASSTGAGKQVNLMTNQLT